VSFNDPVWLEEERRCLAALRRGDGAAFARLYKEFAQPLYARVLLPILSDAQAAEDALADTFRVMIERLERYEDRGASIWSWLATIAANKARDIERGRARDGRALRGLATALQASDEPEAAPPVAPDAPLDPEVAGVLASINPRYRRALELRFLEDRPRAECASLLGVKLGTFDVLLLRALRAFRERWQRDVAAAAPAETAAGRPVST
jgi:RNA polymerase sigma-70 factor (ECF subfamily)